MAKLLSDAPDFSAPPGEGGGAGRLSTAGFTLVELMVAVTITVIILGLLLQVLGFASSNWQKVNDNTKAFEGARAAFDSITRQLSQTTLGTYYEYYDSNHVPYPLATNADAQVSTVGTNAAKGFFPSVYGRFSYLHFITGTNLVPEQKTHAMFFQAPLDFEGRGTTESSSGQLNAIGYFIQYTNDVAGRPAQLVAGLPAPRNRYRLMQYFQPTQNLMVYSASDRSWITNAASLARPFAENIICLVLWPKKTDEEGAATGTNLIAPHFTYDSRTTNWPPGAAQPVQMHQLPPTVRVLMVAVDESSAGRLAGPGTFTDGLFSEPASYAADLVELEKRLRDGRLNYRVFQSDVPLRAAKWSE
jgi:uncharacterized protein (TIGR02599 family)